MTVEQIASIVDTVAKDFDFGKNDSRLLVRYYVYKHCKWMTQSSIARVFGVKERNVHEGIKTIENASQYAFIKLMINKAIKSHLRN